MTPKAIFEGTLGEARNYFLDDLNSEVNSFIAEYGAAAENDVIPIEDGVATGEAWLVVNPSGNAIPVLRVYFFPAATESYVQSLVAHV